MRSTVMMVALLALLVLTLSGCCPKDKCIEKYDLGDPDDCEQWALEHDCVPQPGAGPKIIIKKKPIPGGGGARVEYGIDETDQTDGGGGGGYLRKDFIGIQIDYFQCVDPDGVVHDAQYVVIEEGSRKIIIERMAMDVLRWSGKIGAQDFVFKPTDDWQAGTVPGEIYGLDAVITDTQLNKTCDEVKLRVLLP